MRVVYQSIDKRGKGEWVRSLSGQWAETAAIYTLIRWNRIWQNSKVNIGKYKNVKSNTNNNTTTTTTTTTNNNNNNNNKIIINQYDNKIASLAI